MLLQSPLFSRSKPLKRSNVQHPAKIQFKGAAATVDFRPPSGGGEPAISSIGFDDGTFCGQYMRQTVHNSDRYMINDFQEMLRCG
jgi:hypothetical protein